MTHYAFHFDGTRCTGCKTCEMACKDYKDLGLGVAYRKVYEVTLGETKKADDGTFASTCVSYPLSLACNHCENPACVKVCPVGATYKDPDTGVVRQDYDKCIGCRMCMSACPYTGVRSFNWEEPQYAIGQPMGSLDIPQHQKQVVEKCTMCWHRLAKGEEPMCVKTCLARARFWGDLDDPESDVSQMIATRNYKQLLEDRGTKVTFTVLAMDRLRIDRICMAIDRPDEE